MFLVFSFFVAELDKIDSLKLRVLQEIKALEDKVSLLNFSLIERC